TGGVRETTLGGEQEAKIISLRLDQPPKGFANWTLGLLAERAVALEIVESVSHETMRQTLKKNGMTNRKIQYWVIPPEADAEFVAHMEEVLEPTKCRTIQTYPSSAWTNSLCSY